MSRPPLKAAILVVSTTASKDPSTDASESTLRSVFEQDGGGQWTVTDVKIVPDSTVQIQKHIVVWADEGINLIVTTGGTGFAIHDNTPEAVLPLLHRPLSLWPGAQALSACKAARLPLAYFPPSSSAVLRYWLQTKARRYPR